MRVRRLLIPLIGAFGIGCGGSSPGSIDRSSWMPERASQFELQVRNAFTESEGHAPKANRDLLRYMDKRVDELPKLDEESIDELVQAYGATLGQVLIAEVGGRWVERSVDGHAMSGVELPNHKVAFVFNRAWKRIAEKDPTGFEAYYDSALALVRGEALRAGNSTAQSD